MMQAELRRLLERDELTPKRVIPAKARTDFQMQPETGPRCRGDDELSSITPTLAAVLLTAALAGCTVGPNYHRPVATVATSAWKAAPGWLPAQPADDRPRAAWWMQFNDRVLNDLEAQVASNNQNVAAAVAAVEQAQAVVRENRAALFPTVGLSAGATRTSSGGGTTIVGGTGATGTGTTGTGTGTTVVTGSGATPPDTRRQRQLGSRPVRPRPTRHREHPRQRSRQRRRSRQCDAGRAS